MYLQLQFEYKYFEILCIFSLDFNTKRQQFCCWSNSTYGKSYPVSSIKAKCCIFSCSFFDKVIAELTAEFVFYGTLLSYCCLMSANVSGLVNLCVTCNDIQYRHRFSLQRKRLPNGSETPAKLCVLPAFEHRFQNQPIR